MDAISVIVIPLKKKGKRVLVESPVNAKIDSMVLSVSLDLDVGDFVTVQGPGPCGKCQFRISRVLLRESKYELTPDSKFC